ncbi:hypothetical protein NSK_004735 [Nannochloropsis salina CCMP1776]|jgi:fructosamine-3-kinase|uniref:protein-ribulosamine 3-kinase n=1 Tax=Nannochloropsis salina CCMP1776 TaxID=1027361 RepID=A0A4D9CWD8_9STRA|nr:hypothetical protein NSK_004735 [Nannochloropsis salina CCMP1776]|eukprot:TFJ83631.1 hypothetical protein NSK_004735 [Nannochloropsis salina CCMP1776]
MIFRNVVCIFGALFVAFGGVQAFLLPSVQSCSAWSIWPRGVARQNLKCNAIPAQEQQSDHSQSKVQGNLADVIADARAQEEAEKIMKELEDGAVREMGEAQAAGPKYMPSTEPDDPIVMSLQKVLGVGRVEKWELLDSRWNGNEVFKYTTDKGLFFIKLNRVEDPSVFLTEAVGLSALAATNTLPCPKPLHLGKLPKVGDVGPGAFMVLEHLKLLPFGIMRTDMQQRLGEQLAALHLDQTHAALHRGRFGFSVSNFLALTPLNNTWTDDWPSFLARRLESQVAALYQEKQYGRAALNETDLELRTLGSRVIRAVPALLAGVKVSPSLIHGDLWIGNAGATEAGPVIFDPACFFGHHEMELAMMTLFGGFRDEFWNAYHARLPKEKGFETRQKLYQFYYYLNQLNLFGDAGVKRTCVRLAEELLLI